MRPICNHKIRLGRILSFILTILVTIWLTGCETNYPWNLQKSTFRTLVVDGMITNELKTHCINLTLTNPSANMDSEPVSGALVVVSDKNNTYIFTESVISPGNYYSAPFQATAGKKYELSISYQDLHFTAVDSMVAITELTGFNLSLVQKDSLFSYHHIKEGLPAMIDINLDWSGNTDYIQHYGASSAKETFYTLNNVDINDAFSADKQVIYFPKGTKIVRHKYSLSPQHQNFIRSLLMETEWRGGLFDVQQGNVSTNLTNGALGFFSVCMCLKDSVIVK